jgi:multicomponent K+:H+ antiporter subunit E
MRHLLPYPLISLGLLAMWLLLNGAADPATLLAGAALAVGGGLVFGLLEPPAGGARRLRLVLELLWIVSADIVRSNLAVARIVLVPGTPRVAGFLSMPLRSDHPGLLAVMALIITATPGTSWARYDGESGALTIHVFDLVDEAEWIRVFKDRYERRLLEIFA